jgi:hypothetical protein
MKEKFINDTIQAMKDGSEVVIISNDFQYDSSIFWINDGVLFSFCRGLGVMERTDMNMDGFKNHLRRMIEESSVFVRGYRD